MVRALSVRVAREYVLLDERELPESDRSVFMLRAATGLERLQMRSYALSRASSARSDGEGAANAEAGARSIEWAAAHLVVGWRNVNDEDGRNLAFSSSALERLPADVLFELGAAALDLKLDRSDQGKSEGPSTSSSDGPPPAPSAET